MWLVGSYSKIHGEIKDIAISSFVSSVIGSSSVQFYLHYKACISRLFWIPRFGRGVTSAWNTMCSDTLPSTRQSSQHQCKTESFNSHTEKARHRCVKRQVLGWLSSLVRISSRFGIPNCSCLAPGLWYLGSSYVGIWLIAAEFTDFLQKRWSSVLASSTEWCP